MQRLFPLPGDGAGSVLHYQSNSILLGHASMVKVKVEFAEIGSCAFRSIETRLYVLRLVVHLIYIDSGYFSIFPKLSNLLC